MTCYCVQLLENEVARLKEEMFRAVDEYGYNHPSVHLISSKIDPLVHAITQVQLHKARGCWIARGGGRGNQSMARKGSGVAHGLSFSADASPN